MTPPVFLHPVWPAPANIRALITTRRGGASRGDYAEFNLGRSVADDPAAVEANRAALRAALPGDVTWLRQVHGSRCVRLPESGDVTADAAWTDDADRVCTVQVADCMPVFFARQDGSAVGVAHAGWRGMAGGVLESTVQSLRQAGGAQMPLIAWLGPCIGPQAFEVGPEVREAFLDRDPAAGLAFLDRGNRKWLCNLRALARRRLNRAGVTAVFGGNFCTYTDTENFFSYRRATHEGRDTGRMAAVIWRER